MSTDFIALGIPRELEKQLNHQGITTPTPVQQQTIPLILNGRDLMAQAQTGTGKTLAFLLPLIKQLSPKPYIQVLIVAPTRELALQITQVATALMPPGLNLLAVYGGQDVARQQQQLKTAVQLVVATPGRLLDHLERGTITLTGVTKLVIDEADQLLALGFLPDIHTIIAHTSPQRQLLLFSATLPAKIQALARQFMRKPALIEIKTAHVTLDEINQSVIQVPEPGKIDVLCQLIDKHNPYLAIVFCHTKQRATMVTALLHQRGYAVDELHGDLSQAKRQQVIKRFAQAKLQILTATDIAARGLDIEAVTHIFNFDIPHDPETYIHRIGRTARAGETGTAITLITPLETKYLQLIEQKIAATLDKFNSNGQPITSRTKPTLKHPKPPRHHAATTKRTRK